MLRRQKPFPGQLGGHWPFCRPIRGTCRARGTRRLIQEEASQESLGSMEGRFSGRQGGPYRRPPSAVAEEVVLGAQEREASSWGSESLRVSGQHSSPWSAGRLLPLIPLGAAEGVQMGARPQSCGGDAASLGFGGPRSLHRNFVRECLSSHQYSSSRVLPDPGLSAGPTTTPRNNTSATETPTPQPPAHQPLRPRSPAPLSSSR